MVGQPWLADTLAAGMLATAVYCAVRLAASHMCRRSTERDADLMHVAMGVAMASMLVSRLNPLTGRLWAVAFGLATAWFGGRLVRDSRRRLERQASHHVPHLLGCVAMLYMLMAAPGAAGGRAAAPGAAMAGGGSPSAAAGVPALTAILAVSMLGCVVWLADRLALSPAGAAAVQPPSRPILAPRVAACCQIVTGITMGYMLVLML